MSFCRNKPQSNLIRWGCNKKINKSYLFRFSSVDFCCRKQNCVQVNGTFELDHKKTTWFHHQINPECLRKTFFFLSSCSIDWVHLNRVGLFYRWMQTTWWLWRRTTTNNFIKFVGRSVCTTAKLWKPFRQSIRPEIDSIKRLGSIESLLKFSARANILGERHKIAKLKHKAAANNSWFRESGTISKHQSDEYFPTNHRDRDVCVGVKS